MASLKSQEIACTGIKEKIFHQQMTWERVRMRRDTASNNINAPIGEKLVGTNFSGGPRVNVGPQMIFVIGGWECG